MLGYHAFHDQFSHSHLLIFDWVADRAGLQAVMTVNLSNAASKVSRTARRAGARACTPRL
ncbi:hypothetical protein CTT39_23730 [Agrobacterium rosae]|nr:hypothetical protein CTT39_23730 [Agrobacterium rosae]